MKLDPNQTSRATEHPSVDDAERYYHGTTAELRPKNRIRPPVETGRPGNFTGYDSADYAYAADNPHTAAIYADRALDAAYARNQGYGKARRVYEVAPVGEHEPDPNETNGIRSRDGFRVVRRVPAGEWR